MIKKSIGKLPAASGISVSTSVMETLMLRPNTSLHCHNIVFSIYMSMQRRFNAVDIKDLLRKEGIRLKPNLPPHQKPEDCFEPWDYENNCSPVEDQPEVPIAVVSVT